MSDTDFPDETPTTYEVILKDEAVAERDRFYFSLIGYDPKYAKVWFDRLEETIANLVTFPGPLSHAIDTEATENFGYEVRRLLYHGPSGRRVRTPYRVLYTILPNPNAAEPTTIVILRILHGSQQLMSPDNENP